MKIHLKCRFSALITLAFFTAINVTAFGQKSTPLATTRFNQLLTTGEAGSLRAELLKQPGATLGRKGVSESQSGTFNRKAVTVDIASQFISTREGEVEQVAIFINDGGQTKTLSLAQFSNGGFGRLVNGILEPYEQAALNYETCLFGSENAPAACEKCLDQITECSNPNTAIASACMVGRLLNPVGACVRCGVLSITQVLTCLFQIAG